MRRSLAVQSSRSLPSRPQRFSSAALAHVGDHSHMGFIEGVLHPFSGLDHVLAMVAVGLWASQLGGRALWLLPLTFPVVMAVGAALGFGGVPLPWVEIGIAASVLVLGAAVALALRPSLAVSLPLIGAVRAAARLQPRRRAAGECFGADLRARASSPRLVLHLAGIAIGLAANRVPLRFAARTAGGAIASVGVVLLWCTERRFRRSCADISIIAGLGRHAARKNQRLDHHRHRAGASSMVPMSM